MTASTSMKIVGLYRYPVKGMSPEPLENVRLETGNTLPFDRAYAMENGPGKFDPARPRHLPKINFVMLMRNEKLARLKTSFDDNSQELSISLEGKTVVRASLNSASGRAAIERFIAGYMPEDLRGAPRIVSAPDHSFSDVADKCLHIINMNSVRELQRLMQPQLQGRPLDPMRFRANMIIDGPAAFSELQWPGKTLSIGKARLEIFKRTKRCPATNVDPQSARREGDLPQALYENFGHRDFGLYARVIRGGEISCSDRPLLSS